MRRLSLFLSLFFGVVACLSAQKMVHISGEYTYHVPEHVSMDEAKRTALYRAKIQALADAFGTVVSQSNTTVVKNENGKSSTELFSLGGSDVRGEWIETIGEPVFDIFYEEGMLVVKVAVEGKAREIKSAGIALDVKVLRNGTEQKFENDEFVAGDDLFLYFKSPTDGFLAVYLLDETTQEAYCLLPYKASGVPAQKIIHDQPYVFFSSEASEENSLEVDEYTLTCSKEVEYNTLYVLFSPNPFAKANAEDDAINIPRQLPLKDFQTWLVKAQSKDSQLQTIYKHIKITHS